MDVRSTSFHPNRADDGETRVTHGLVFLVRERLDRGHRDRVARVNPHGIQIFNRTNDHAVVSTVTHDLHLEFLPAEKRFFNEHFAHGREIQAAQNDLLEFLAVVGDTATCTTQREGGTNDEWIGSNLERHRAGFLECVGDT